MTLLCQFEAHVARFSACLRSMSQLVKNFTGQLAGIEDFLQFPARRKSGRLSLPHDNAAPTKRKRGIVATDEDRRQLVSFFHPFNEQLYDFIVKAKLPVVGTRNPTVKYLREYFNFQTPKSE